MWRSDREISRTNEAVLVRRDTHEKITVSLDEIEAKVSELLDTIQSDMLERARAHRDSHTYVATTYDEFVKTINEKPGFVKAMWCGDQACEDQNQRRYSCDLPLHAVCTGESLR